MHEEATSRPVSVPSSVAATTTQPTATDHNSTELQVSYSASSADLSSRGHTTHPTPEIMNKII
ncbi:hypothetical protein L798_15157 [Zootermopsis nevadensis]|uniref:Uncharacterized protein n=1 Tax=Zootermopsis nevadensis TaxID=136037 RepID=A0A067QLF9_ZOONE|nr:hypothetical protein L798_15157 [Zootermopsis nevadensis]